VKKLIALILVAGTLAISIGCSGSPTTKASGGGGGGASSGSSSTSK
jgi:hypothetical protein